MQGPYARQNSLSYWRRLTREPSYPSRLATRKNCFQSCLWRFFFAFPVPFETVLVFTHVQVVQKRNQQSFSDVSVADSFPAHFNSLKQRDPKTLPDVDWTINYLLRPNVLDFKIYIAIHRQQLNLNAAFLNKNYHAKSFFSTFHVNVSRSMSWFMQFRVINCNFGTMRNKLRKKVLAAYTVIKQCLRLSFISLLNGYTGWYSPANVYRPPVNLHLVYVFYCNGTQSSGSVCVVLRPVRALSSLLKAGHAIQTR